MNLDELRSVQAKERRKDSLQHLRDAFYDDVAAYISDLRAARDRRAEEVDKPFSDDDVRRMSDEIETAEEVAEALYERRVGKVVKLASFAAADMPVETEGLTTQERNLFNDLVERIGENKSTVLDVLAGKTTPTDASAGEAATAGEAESTAVADASTEPNPDPVSVDADDRSHADDALASAMGGRSSDGDPGSSEKSTDPEVTSTEATSAEPMSVEPESAPPGASGVSDGGRVEDGSEPDGDRGEPDGDRGEPDGDRGEDTTTSGASSEVTARGETDRTTVRITRDVGSILGVDEREYDLASEDVVTLPAANADPLVQRDAAERID